MLVGLVGLAAVDLVKSRANDRLEAVNDQLEAVNERLIEANARTGRALNDANKAELAVEEALKKSEDSRLHAEEVSRFLVDAFRSPDPSQDGHTVRVFDVLDRAVDRLDREFAGPPTTRADLLSALSQTYAGLGLFDKAAALDAKVLTVREAALGPNHPDTRATRQSLASDLASLGADLLQDAKYAEAERPLRESLALRARYIPEDTPRFEAMSLLGEALTGQAKYDEAEPLLIQGYEGLKARATSHTDAAARLVRLYVAWGKPAKAAEWKPRAGLPDLPADVFTRP
jgi:tetratricopeptide (TPR) repeat protein